MKVVLGIITYKTGDGKPHSRTCLELIQDYDDVLETIGYWIEDFDSKNIEAKDKLFQIALDFIRGYEESSYMIVLRNGDCNIRIKIQEL